MRSTYKYFLLYTFGYSYICTSAEIAYYNKILQQLHENQCSTIRGGIFEIFATFITSVAPYNRCNTYS